MKHRILIKNTLFAIVSIIFILSALGKFAGRETILALFADAGMSDYVIRFAVIQIIIVACLWHKPLRTLGVLVGSAFLGGIIVIMMSTDASPLSAGLTLLMLWSAYKLQWWGYWNHKGEDCSCGWCKKDSAHCTTCKRKTCKCT